MKELLDPLPSMRIRGDFDQSLIPELQDLECLKLVGDIEILDGLRLITDTGSHGREPMFTGFHEDGVYILAGDTVHVLPSRSRT